MVNLEPYFRSHHFEHGMRMLEKGYVAARDSLNAEIERITRDSAAYEEALANGAEPIAEYDEDGNLLWEQSQVFEINIDDVHTALFEVRKAFAIALYHFWEASVAQWMKVSGKPIDHEKLVRYCASEGYGPSTDLEAVRCLVNYLKHGRNSRKDWLAKLRGVDPSFLPQARGATSVVSEDILFRVAAAILASGPNTAGLRLTS